MLEHAEAGKQGQGPVRSEEIAVDGWFEQQEAHQRVNEHQQEPGHTNGLAGGQPAIRDGDTEVLQRAEAEIACNQYKRRERKPLVQDEEWKVLPRHRPREMITEHSI
jgi:hypothetical protein